MVGCNEMILSYSREVGVMILLLYSRVYYTVFCVVHVLYTLVCTELYIQCSYNLLKRTNFAALFA